MREVVIVAAMAVIPASANAEARNANAVVDPAVVIRFYPSIAAEDVGNARKLAGDILGAAGISVSWRYCGRRGREPQHEPMAEGCDRPPSRNELILHIVPATDGNAALHRRSLGFSLIDPQTATGKVAKVYADRVAEMARDAGANRARLLARAIAHEIGHLLLGNNRHSAQGLMRAVWSREELRRNVAGDWVFLEEEAHRIAARFR
jgi:hypothetical protein